ncbi:hypothetical protein [Ruminococcus flavefaciens]|uniref:hypothetical protein n=1 Tax=Ruminococcus flavefaciens TaxID=1265 RepID=UPI0026F2516B|nr:hypothetical protein [Ruminococcus flavefaciens]
MNNLFFDNVKISDTDISFEQIYNKEYIPEEYIDDIKKANLLIIPNESFRDEGDILFPETTREFYDYIRENANDDIVADIAISDDDFQRIELHSAVITVATIIVKNAVLPIVTGMISAFLYDLLKKHHRKSEDTTAKVKIITEETKSKKCKTITYEGPVSGIKEALDEAAKDIFSKD